MQRTAHDQPIDDSIQCVPEHVKRALAYMRSNMAEKIPLPALASACAAERTLLKQLQKSVGVSPLAYLRR